MSFINSYKNQIEGSNNLENEPLPWESSDLQINKQDAKVPNSKIQNFKGNKLKFAIGTFILVCLIVGFTLFKTFNNQSTVSLKTSETGNASETTKSEIQVHVGGAVKNPGVYKLSLGQRIIDLINLAGGLNTDADSDQVNLAKTVEDGEQIIIPSKTASTSTTTDSSSATSSGTQNGKVNINTADATTLQTLSGVGASTAQKIIDYRNSNGKFKTIDDLKNVSGIGDKTFAKFADKICV